LDTEFGGRTPLMLNLTHLGIIVPSVYAERTEKSTIKGDNAIVAVSAAREGAPALVQALDRTKNVSTGERVEIDGLNAGHPG
jgi:hypothetical protein